jgi:hypothetical protein
MRPKIFNKKNSSRKAFDQTISKKKTLWMKKFQTKRITNQNILDNKIFSTLKKFNQKFSPEKNFDLKKFSEEKNFCQKIFRCKILST